MAKKKPLNDKKNGPMGAVEELAKVLTGEVELVKKKKELERLKKAAIEQHKDVERLKVIQGEVDTEKEDIMDKKVVQKITIFEWEVPIRYSFSFDNRTFLIIVGVAMLFILYLAVLGHYGLMGAIIALLFFLYAAGTVQPIDVTHKVTTRGIETNGKLFEWYMLDQFWFAKKEDTYFLHVTTELRFPTGLIMLVDKKDLDPIFIVLQDKLLYREVKKQSKFDRLSYGEYIPLEEV